MIQNRFYWFRIKLNNVPIYMICNAETTSLFIRLIIYIPNDESLITIVFSFFLSSFLSSARCLSPFRSPSENTISLNEQKNIDKRAACGCQRQSAIAL